MGKNKGHAQKRAFKKDPVATKVAGVKKTKTKAVVTSLKRVSALTDPPYRPPPFPYQEDHGNY